MDLQGYGHYTVIDLEEKPPSDKVDLNKYENNNEIEYVKEIPSTSACCLLNETLLQGVNPKANVLDKIGTACNFLWKKFWNTNEITIENNKVVSSQDYTTKDISADSPACRWASFCAFEYNPLYIPIITSCIIAQTLISIPTAIGMALKRISVCTSKKSKAFYLFIETYDDYSRRVVNLKENYMVYKKTEKNTSSAISTISKEILDLTNSIKNLNSNETDSKIILEKTVKEKEVELRRNKDIHFGASQLIRETDQLLKKWNRILNQLAANSLKQPNSYNTFSDHEEVEFLTFGYKEERDSINMIYDDK